MSLIAVMSLLGLSAAQAQEWSLPYALLGGLEEGGVDEAASGPGMLSLGPDGLVALYHAAQRAIYVLQGPDLPPLRIPVREASSIAWSSTRLLVLDHPARRLSLFESDGTLLSQSPLPGTVPQHGRLALRAEEVSVVDLFGNHHAAARVEQDLLLPPDAPPFQEVGRGLRWDAQRREIVLGQDRIELPQALQASARWLGPNWLLMDWVLEDEPLVVKRVALHHASGQQVDLPIEDRAYVPRLDVSEDPEGRLVWLDPRPEGLVIRWEAP